MSLTSEWPSKWTLHSPGGLVFGRFIVFRRTDMMFVVFDPRLPLGEDAGVHDGAEGAVASARALASQAVAEAKAVSKYNADAESFAGMRRGLANGFAWHEPAYAPGEAVAP